MDHQEGDPIAVAERRSETFPDSFSIHTSTPTVKNFSRIEAEYLETDQRKWFVQCPGCKGEFVIMWRDIRWDKGPAGENLVETAHLICPKCGVRHDDPARQKMVMAGKWVATNPRVKDKPGFWANGFLCLLRGKRNYRNRLHQWAAEFLEAKHKGPEVLRTFVNTVFAESYEEESDKPPEPEMLYARREVYDEDQNGEMILPKGVFFLVVGADVQQDRIEAEILGIGALEETWGIEYKIFRGNTDTPQLFGELDQWLLKRWKHPSGHWLAPACACIDAANKPEQIYAYVRRCAPRLVYASRGQRGDVSKSVNRSAGRNPRLFTLKVDGAKEGLYSRLRLVEHGPGFQHFPLNSQAGYDSTYFKQLESESMRTSFVEGRQVRYFDLQTGGAHNEALDARVYALAAKEILDPDYGAIQKNLDRAPLNDWRSKPAAPTPCKKDDLASILTPPPPAEGAKRVRPTNFGLQRGWSSA